MTQPADQPATRAVVVPDKLEAGVYANVVNVWHTGADFTLDFLVQVPGGVPMTLPDGTSAAAEKLRLVSRVKLPPQQIFEIMKALEQQLSRYEAERDG